MSTALPSPRTSPHGLVAAAPRWRRALLWALGLPPAYAGLLSLLLLAAGLRPQLLSLMLLPLIARQAAALGLALIGQSLVMRGRSIDLSSGGVIVAVSYLLTSGYFGVSDAVSMLLCVLLCVLLWAWSAARLLAPWPFALLWGGIGGIVSPLPDRRGLPRRLDRPGLLIRRPAGGRPAPGWWLCAAHARRGRQ